LIDIQENTNKSEKFKKSSSPDEKTLDNKLSEYNKINDTDQLADDEMVNVFCDDDEEKDESSCKEKVSDTHDKNYLSDTNLNRNQNLNESKSDDSNSNEKSIQGKENSKKRSRENKSLTKKDSNEISKE
jgi:hypothetical protein